MFLIETSIERKINNSGVTTKIMLNTESHNFFRYSISIQIFKSLYVDICIYGYYIYKCLMTSAAINTWYGLASLSYHFWLRYICCNVSLPSALPSATYNENNSIKILWDFVIKLTNTNQYINITNTLSLNVSAEYLLSTKRFDDPLC